MEDSSLLTATTSTTEMDLATCLKTYQREIINFKPKSTHLVLILLISPQEFTLRETLSWSMLNSNKSLKKKRSMKRERKMLANQELLQRTTTQAQRMNTLRSTLQRLVTKTQTKRE